MSYLPEGKVVNIKVFFDTRDPLSPVVERYLEFYPDGNLPHENAQAALAAGAQPQQVEPASPIKAAEQPPRYTKPLVLRLPGLSKYKHLRTKLAALGYDAKKYSRMFVGDLLMFSDESILNNKRFTKIEDDGYVHVICRDKQWRPSDVPENNRVGIFDILRTIIVSMAVLFWVFAELHNILAMLATNLFISLLTQLND